MSTNKVCNMYVTVQTLKPRTFLIAPSNKRSQLEVKRNQVLLDLAGVIFQEQSTIDNMIHRILTHMLSLIRCERAMLLLVHQG